MKYFRCFMNSFTGFYKIMRHTCSFADSTNIGEMYKILMGEMIAFRKTPIPYTVNPALLAYSNGKFFTKWQTALNGSYTRYETLIFPISSAGIQAGIYTSE